MKWTTNDINLYLQSKEYVDTAVIPLIPVSWSSNVKKTIEIGEFTSILSHEIERQFKGRLILYPAFTYSEKEGRTQSLARLQTWSDEILTNGLKHIVYVTADSQWKGYENELAGTIISLPSIPLEHLDEKLKQSMFQDQMKSLITLFMRIWQS
ncbi:YpiF family protein [Litchfieldia alkalitelluris]|uniref:YpiF family protein n=1 Tax=Litchfieldia alkalitelluris TaxID=304268 RepID=UPI00099672F3|nr:YpiF family protein [Litchfieldia alkalitelluris]